MTSYRLAKSIKLKDEDKHILNVSYFLVEEFKLKESADSYGIKVETSANGIITDNCTVNDITESKEEALLLIKKMADYKVTAITAKDIIDDMMF